MIRRKTFDCARFMKKWLVIEDGTQLYSGSRKLNEQCLECHYNRVTEEETVMEICRNNKWDFIIRYKKGSIPSIAVEYEAIQEKERTGHAEFINEIDYNGKSVNVLRFWETKIQKGESVTTEFQWLKNIRITGKNANATVMKNHYLMMQIADMVKQLYEWFYLQKNEIKNVDNINFIENHKNRTKGNKFTFQYW